jgi:AraC-like DNA-binding protein
MDQFIQSILYLGGIQGILLSVFLFTIKANKISNRLLGLLTLLWGVFLFSFALQSEGLYRKFPHLLKVFYQFLFIFFPLLYLQVKYLLGNYKKFYRKDLIHFLPFGLSILLYVDFYIQSGSDKILMIQNKTQYYEVLQIIGDEFIAIQGIFYSILALRLISKYRNNIINYQSNIDKKILKVISIGISLNLFSWVIGTIGIHLDYLNINTGIDMFALAYLVLVIVIYIISYTAIRSPEVYKLDESQIKVVSINRQAQNPGFSISLNKDRAVSKNQKFPEHDCMDSVNRELNEKLILYMEAEKPYLNPELSLPDLAEKMNITRNQLSNIINQNHQMNFYEFINQYRITEVKGLMADSANKHFKLISLAYDAGFNSKASFNRVFKQMTEMTPSQYYLLQKAV